MSTPHPDSLRLFTDPLYRPPSPDDVRAVCDLLNLKQDEIAGLTGKNDGRAVRRWLAPITARTHVQIEFAPWRLLLLEAGLVSRQKRLRKPVKLLSPDKVAKPK